MLTIVVKTNPLFWTDGLEMYVFAEAQLTDDEKSDSPG